MKIKIFAEFDDINKLGDAITEFLAGRTIIDIKYNSICHPNRMVIYHTVLIFWE
jgi:hypothetical protein